MQLFELSALLSLDDSKFNQGVKNAESAGQKLAGKMSAMTVAVGNIAADMIRKGAQAISQVVNGAIDGYADYQQLIGGVETLFKSSAGKVAQYAKQSYKTTGLSANDYMETVTSFSASLLQGLGGDTEAAADIANTAVTDMADNANKMGTDISSIQAAYMGFAKQNYTMLDNLKLGYGGTQQEMVRLINDSGILEDEIKDLDGITFDQMVEAIHKVQTEMGITGTTAAEAAETISGSKASLTAAWQDLLSAVGGEGDEKRLDETLENFKTSFSTYMENFIPTLVKTINNSGSLVTAIAESIGNLPTDLLSSIAESGLEAGTEMVGGLSTITSWIIDNITNMFKSASANPEKVAEFGKAIGDFLGTAIGDIVKNAPDILKGIVDVGINLAGGLVEGLFKGLFGEKSEVDKVMDQLNGSITDAEKDATQANAIIGYMQKLYDESGKAAQNTEAWKNAVSELDKVLPGAGQTITDYGTNVEGALGKLREMNEEQRKSVIMSALQGAWSEAHTMLTQQKYERNVAQAQYDMNESIVEQMLPNVRKAIMEAAGKQAQDYYTSTHDEEGNVLPGMTYNQDWADELNNLAQGLTEAGGELVNLSELDWDGLQGILMSMQNEELNKAVEDETAARTDALAKMEQAQKEIDRLTKEIQATEEQVAVIDEATQRTVEEMLGKTEAAGEEIEIAGEEAGKGIKEGGDTTKSAILASGGLAALGITGAGAGVSGALNELKEELSGFVPFLPFGGETPHANGMDYVPFNGYKAELHKGEMVLTKNEADNYRAGGGTGEIVAALQSLRNDMRNMKLVVGKKAFGRAMVDYGGGRMDGYIGEAEGKYLKGYGG